MSTVTRQLAAVAITPSNPVEQRAAAIRRLARANKRRTDRNIVQRFDAFLFGFVNPRAVSAALAAADFATEVRH